MLTKMADRAGHLVGVMIAVACLAPMRAAAQPDPLVQARDHYNAGRFDEAIRSADSALSDPVRGTAAAVIAARARLERYRLEREQPDLEAARGNLRTVRPDSLSARERIEWEIGLAQLLYLNGHEGPASELFAALLDRTPQPVEVGDRERLLDWWATAVERDAQQRAIGERAVAYQRLLERMEQELAKNAASSAATYWIAAAARGAGDLDRAWNLAVAAWVRADVLAQPHVLRADLDRLVLQGIIPDRARRRARRGGDSPVVFEAMAVLAAEWEEIKARWERP